MKTKLRFLQFALASLIVFNASAQIEGQERVMNQEIPPQSEITFTLIDPITDLPIPGFDPIPENARFEMQEPYEHLNIRANVPDGYKSVRFDLNETNNFRVENAAPFALFGDQEGDYDGGIFTYDIQTISATPYQETMAMGDPGNTSTIQLLITNKETHLIVVDAETDMDLFPLENQMIIDADKFSNGSWNFRTSHDREVKDIKVLFELYGPLRKTRTERGFPYALFGNDEGDFFGRNLPPGDYQLEVVYGRKGVVINAQDVSISVKFKVARNSITSFNHRGEHPESFQFHVDDGDNFYPSRGTFLGPATIFASTAFEAGSVVFQLNGPINHRRIENYPPYSVFGDNEGAFNYKEFPFGTYTLKATPYSEPNGKGAPGIVSTVVFEIKDGFPAVSYVYLVDVDSDYEYIDDNVIAYLDSTEGVGELVDASVTPTDNATIYVEYPCEFLGCENPGSIVLELEGPVSSSRIENIAPFTLFGNFDGTIFGRNLPPGDYTFKATTYSGPNATGVASDTGFRYFRIFESDNTMLLKTFIYPNPTSALVHIDSGDSSILAAEVLDMNGKAVIKVPELRNANTIDVSSLEKGIYILRMQTEKGKVTKKIIVE